MIIKFAISTVLEIAVAGFIIWGLFFEDVLIDFEDRLWARIKRRGHRAKIIPFDPTGEDHRNAI